MAGCLDYSAATPNNILFAAKEILIFRELERVSRVKVYELQQRHAQAQAEVIDLGDRIDYEMFNRALQSSFNSIKRIGRSELPWQSWEPEETMESPIEAYKRMKADEENPEVQEHLKQMSAALKEELDRRKPVAISQERIEAARKFNLDMKRTRKQRPRKRT